MNLRLFSVGSKYSRFAGMNIVAETAEEALNLVWPPDEPKSPHAKKRENMVVRDITANHASTLDPVFAKNKKGYIVWCGKKSGPFEWAFVDEMLENKNQA